MFQQIMVPLDGTPLAEQALSPAVSLARRRGAQLHLATVLKRATDVPDPFADVAPGGAEDEYLEKVAERVRDAGVSTVSTARVPGDHIAEALDDHRKEAGAGLTVMCTHGRVLVKRAWLGSVADGLVRTSEAPVLLVRAKPGDEARSRELRTDMSFKRVLVALDGSHFSRQALSAAAELAGKTDTVYVLARVIEAPNPAAEATDERMQKARAVAEAKLDLEVQSFAPDGYAVEPVVEFAPSVAQGILDLAEDREADVIVIATHARKGVSRLMLGSVADKVVRGADLPVLLVRPRGP